MTRLLAPLTIALSLLASAAAFPGSNVEQLARAVDPEALHAELHNAEGYRFKHVELARRQVGGGGTNNTITSPSPLPPPPSTTLTPPPSSNTPPTQSPSTPPTTSPSTTPTTPPSTTTVPTTSKTSIPTTSKTSTPTETKTSLPPSSTVFSTSTPPPSTSSKMRTVTGSAGEQSTVVELVVVTPSEVVTPVATVKQSGFTLAGSGAAPGLSKSAGMGAVVAVVGVVAGMMLV